MDTNKHEHNPWCQAITSGRGVGPFRCDCKPPPKFEGCEERQTRVESEAETKTLTAFPGRDDSQPSSTHAPVPARARDRDRSGNRLIVRKVDGLFELRSFKNGRQIECVKALNAQMILDFVRATWPVGTTIDWVIIPRAPRTIVASYTLTAERDHSWLRRIPVGAHL